MVSKWYYVDTWADIPSYALDKELAPGGKIWRYHLPESDPIVLLKAIVAVDPRKWVDYGSYGVPVCHLCKAAQNHDYPTHKDSCPWWRAHQFLQMIKAAATSPSTPPPPTDPNQGDT